MRLARVAACAAATTLLTTTAAGTASAASAKNELQYSSSTGTGVVQLVLTLPSAIPALPGVPNPVVLTLLGTDAQDFHGAASSTDIATAHSYLAGGSLVTDSALAALLGPLNRTLTADLAHPGTKTADLITVPSNPLGLGLTVAGQKAGVDGVTKLATSSSTLTSASLGSLRSLGLGAVLDPALAQLNAALATVLAQATPLTTGLSALPTLPTLVVPNPLSGILGGPATITTPAVSGSTLSATVNDLPAQINAITAKLLDGAAVKLNGVDTSQGITPAVSAVTAAARSKLLSVELFGGLVTVTATEASASAKAGLTKSAAASNASATLLAVKVSTAVGTLLQLVASDKGITAGLLNGALGQTLSVATRPVVQAVDTALNTVLTELTGLLSTLNSGAALIQQGTVTKKLSADGHSAEAHAAPAQVTLGLPVAPNLLTLSVGKADASSVVAQSAVPPTVTPLPELPHTGLADDAMLLAMGLVVAGLATIRIRRRTGPTPR
jgi:hypothetical protein